MTDSEKTIDRLLYFLIALDIVIFVVAFFFPQLWVTIFHGGEYIDPMGLLRRTASLWAAFALFQTWALLKWRVQPLWLVVVAGLRLSEMFSDWIYLYSASQLTWFAWITLLASPPSNILFGKILFDKANNMLTLKKSER